MKEWHSTSTLTSDSTAHLVKNHHLPKSISDVAWSQFLLILSNKSAYAGRDVIAVPAHYITQDCSNVANGQHCGERVTKSLSVRTHVCPQCGYVADRGYTAAGKIQWRGQRLRGLAGRPKNSKLPEEKEICQRTCLKNSLIALSV